MTPLNPHGQTLVETALVMPFLVIMVVVFIYVFLLCHQLLRLQPQAVEMAMLASTSHKSLAIRTLQLRLLTQTLHGRGVPPLASHSTALLSEWQPSSGISTTQIRGRLTSVNITQRLLPHRLAGRWLPLLTFSCAADMPAEPPIPEED